jgi:uncharacterized protein
MFQIGQYHTLTAANQTKFGTYLTNFDQEVLLPRKFVPKDLKEGDGLEVFIYLDHDERPVATTQRPYLTLNHFAYLRAVDVSAPGAFVDWGLDKQLFVPFREQAERMREGQRYLVYLYYDEASRRLAGSSRVDRWLKNDPLTVEEGEEVELIVWQPTDLGYKVIVNHRHQGLLYENEVFARLEIGETHQGYVYQVRDDLKLDLRLGLPGVAAIEPNAQKVLEALQEAGGFLPLHDKSKPVVITQRLGMSKKAFKKAIGSLYKAQRIDLKPTGIELRSSE